MKENHDGAETGPLYHDSESIDDLLVQIYKAGDKHEESNQEMLERYRKWARTAPLTNAIRSAILGASNSQLLRYMRACEREDPENTR